MIPLKQKFLHKPDEGIYGDCHRAAIASLLELPLDDVPHFGYGMPDSEEFDKRTKDYLRTQGLTLVSIPFHGSRLNDVLITMKGINPNIYYLLGGTSKNGTNHTVIALNDIIVHDPSLVDSGIVAPCDDGFYWVSMFCPIKFMSVQ